MFRTDFGTTTTVTYVALANEIRRIFMEKSPPELCATVNVDYLFYEHGCAIWATGLWYHRGTKYGPKQVAWKGSISELPGNKSVGVSHGVLLHDVFRGKGIGGAIHAARLRMLKEYGVYNSLVCTVNEGNEAELKILRKNGWAVTPMHKGLMHASVNLREGDSTFEGEPN